MTQNLTILQLYPKELNVYGDNGNLLALIRRLEWRGISYDIIRHNTGDTLPTSVDIIIAGGGQDSNQSKIEANFKLITNQLKAWVESGVPTLLICGSYQLFGRYFETSSGQKIAGAGILNLYTKAGNSRMIGNLLINSPFFGEIVGYENHSGNTYLGDGLEPLGQVIRGAGNNETDGQEGVFYKNLIGTYCHGPVLPKNPKLADFLITKALHNKYGIHTVLTSLDDRIEQAAHDQAASRPR